MCIHPAIHPANKHARIPPAMDGRQRKHTARADSTCWPLHVSLVPRPAFHPLASLSRTCVPTCLPPFLPAFLVPTAGGLSEAAGPCYSHPLFKDGLLSGAAIGPDKDKTLPACSYKLGALWRVCFPCQSSPRAAVDRSIKTSSSPHLPTPWLTSASILLSVPIHPSADDSPCSLSPSLSPRDSLRRNQHLPPKTIAGSRQLFQDVWPRRRQCREPVQLHHHRLVGHR